MRMKFIAYDPNSGEKVSLKEHIHHMDKYTTYIFLVMKKIIWYSIRRKSKFLKLLNIQQI